MQMQNYVEEATEEKENGTKDSFTKVIIEINEHIEGFYAFTEVLLMRQCAVEELIERHPGVDEHKQLTEALSDVFGKIMRVADNCIRERGALLHNVPYEVPLFSCDSARLPPLMEIVCFLAKVSHIIAQMHHELAKQCHGVKRD